MEPYRYARTVTRSGADMIEAFRDPNAYQSGAELLARDAEAQPLTWHDGQRTALDGECVINPSGGLLVKGHPIGAGGGLAGFARDACTMHLFERVH